MKHLYIILLFVLLASCEEVIMIDLNSSKPAFVVEARIYKDSVGVVRLSRTISYFSSAESVSVEDARITISDGVIMEDLTHKGNGLYTGNVMIGIEGRQYDLEIEHDGKVYVSNSIMPVRSEITSVRVFKDDSQSIFNPEGKTVFTIRCEFLDDPENLNFYMISFVSGGKLLKGSNFYLLTEQQANHGSFHNINNTISFSESMFYDGGEVEVHLYSIDEPVYNYFQQLNDVLFWKRRVLPPTPYNPVSNINNGALGYFAALTIDSRTIILD